MRNVRHLVVAAHEHVVASTKEKNFAFYAMVFLLASISIWGSHSVLLELSLAPVSFPALNETIDTIPKRSTTTSSSPTAGNTSITTTEASTFLVRDEGVVQSSNATDSDIISTTPPNKDDEPFVSPPSPAPTPNHSSALSETGGRQTLPFYNRTKTATLATPRTGYGSMPHVEFCRWLQRTQSSFASLDGYRILYKVQYDCGGIFRESMMGTGNWLQFVYEVRLLAASSQVNFGSFADVELSCTGEPCLDEILPWLMGHFSSEETKKYLDRYFNQSLSYQCKRDNLNVGWMIPFLRFDLRRMAIAVVGLPQEDMQHPAHSWVSNIDHRDGIGHGYYSKPPHLLSEPSLISNVTLDEVVIHFRCGDIMYRNSKIFRFLKFKEYASRIDPGAKSIGIVTQPFGSTTNSTTVSADDRGQGGNNGTAAGILVSDLQARPRDIDDAVRSSTCESIVYAMVEYLEDLFPQARVTIHNGPGETVALAYARLIMAKKQAFAAPDSTFSIFPVLASFGTGYQMAPTSTMYSGDHKNAWLNVVKAQVQTMDILGNYTDGRLQLMSIPKEDGLYAKQTYHMREENESIAADNIVDWFVNEERRFSIPNSQMK